jgi:hypothetical protein
MRFLVAILLLAQEGLPPVPPRTSAVAQEDLPPVPPRMRTDEEPSAAACTFEIALRGDSCTFEASSATADPRDGSGAALEAGRQACPPAAHGDPGLRKECERAVAEISASDKCATRSRLVDARGRLTPDAQGCAEMLREEISRTGRAATLPTSCCSCLAESRCAVPAPQCKRELADLTPGSALRSCLGKSCSDACSFAAPARSEPEEAPAVPENPKRPRKI